MYTKISKNLSKLRENLKITGGKNKTLADSVYADFDELVEEIKK